LGGKETRPAEHIKERRLRREDQASQGRNWTAPCCARRGGIADVAHPAPSDLGGGIKREKTRRWAGTRDALFRFKTLSAKGLC
jgi:hypothetical protein